MRLPNRRDILHDLRRQAFALANREQARRFARLRRRMKYEGYSLIPFDRHRCIFVRVPKCATQSISRSLFGNLGGGHLTIDDYRQVYSAREFYPYFKFAFVRNPWDRLVSAYFFLRKGGDNRYDKQWYAAHLAGYAGFEAFVHQWLTPANAETGLHFRPQHRFVCDQHNRLGVDFVGYYENLAEHYATIARRLGFDSRLQYINATSNRARDYRTYFTPSMVDTVAAVYARDIELFGYRFDAPEGSPPAPIDATQK